jgi:asparagine synthase (glutamine-hydrolysing)
MCGIAGFIDFKNNSSSDILKEMANSLSHRGVDGEGENFFQLSNSQIGLAHRRLSILDLSTAGKQPMQHQYLYITFNGEIYNYIEIKNELIALNHSFNANSDTEVILHAYEHWGSKCIDKFIGMFAFVIYDSKNEEVFCARDRAGIKPFFYYWCGGLFLFASELKAFHKHFYFKKEISINAVAAYMQFGNVPAPHCIFSHCQKLTAGHYLKLNIKNSKITIKKYWNVYDAYNMPKLTMSFDDAKLETEKILLSAFNYRMISDVPVGVFLSGGYDSACVTALLQKNSNEKLKTFTISVPDIGLNEAPYAKQVSQHLGTDHFEFECSQAEALNLIDSLSYYYDEPFGDSSAIPTMLVCKMAKKQVIVALSADGGDEIFAGYNRYDYLVKYGKRLAQLPPAVRNASSYLMNIIKADKIPILKNGYNFYNRYEKLKGLLKDPSNENMMLNLSQQFTKMEIDALFKSEIKPLPTAYASNELKKEYYSPLAYMMAIDYQTYLSDDILQKVDRASMSFGLEGREPFLDHRVIEWGARLPDHYKYNKGIKKYILKEIVHQYIPKKIMERPKMGFAIPIEKWLLNELKPKINEYLNEKDIISQGIFEFDYIKKMKEDFFNGKKEYALKIWYLFMFQMWYKKWVEEMDENSYDLI